jgi:hypothetical protein
MLSTSNYKIKCSSFSKLAYPQAPIVNGINVYVFDKSAGTKQVLPGAKKQSLCYKPFNGVLFLVEDCTQNIFCKSGAWRSNF